MKAESHTSDLHWLAGIVEGEGCYRRQKGSLTIKVGMTDRDVIERAGRIFGVASHFVPKKPPRQNLWAVWVTGRRAAGWMMTLYPLMGARRKAAIRECLAAWRVSTRKRTHCRVGHELAGANLFQYTTKRHAFDGRACRECRRTYNREYIRAKRAADPAKYRTLQREWYARRRRHAAA